MRVYPFEQTITDLLASWPHQGPVFWFLNFFSHPGFWGALLWAVLAFFVFRQQLRQAFRPTAFTLLAAGAAAGLGDLISRRLVKALVMRPRPHFIDQICTQPYCWGFVSSHSTNVTAAMTVLCLYNRRYLVFAVPIVFLVSTSRVYLQDHYFLDVLGGVGLGFFIGLAVWEVLKLVLKAKFLKTSESPPY